MKDTKAAILLIIFCITPFAYPQTDDRLSRIAQLDWTIGPNSMDLENVQASIDVSKNEAIVLGSSAEEYMFISEGYRGFSPDAVVVRVEGEDADTVVVYSFEEIGFIKTDDWEETIDNDEMLAEIKRGTAEANSLRGDGYEDLFIDEWAQEPHLDRINSIIYWAIVGHGESGGSFINAKALKLGRKGYAEIIWIGIPEQFTSAEASLEPVLASYNYDEGFKYADYIPGTDTVASIGAGALAYKLITGKAAAKFGAGAIAVIAVFAKKLWLFLVLPFLWAWKGIKKKFVKDETNDS